MIGKIYPGLRLRVAALMLASSILADAQPPPALPNMGQDLSPLGTIQNLNPGLSDFPNWLAGNAVTTVVSPLGDTLLVLTSGFNRVYKFEHPPICNPATHLPVGCVAPGTPGLAAWYLPDSSEYVFIYNISTGPPVLKQVLPIRNSTYNGIAFDPSGLAFYVAGGPDDVVHIVTLSASTGTWVEAQNSPLRMNHRVGLGLNVFGNGPVAINEQVAVTPCAAGVAVSTDGLMLVVANYSNDSITVFRRPNAISVQWSMTSELDLRPGKSAAAQAGVPGGEYPFWVVVKGKGTSATAYVSSIRDREVDVVSLGGAPAVTARIPVKGQPNKMTLNAAQSLLYVAEDQSDTVDVIDTKTNAVIETIPVIAPLLPSKLAQFKGANTNSVALSPDENELYVTNGNLNCVAVISLDGASANHRVIGLIPTGWYPNSASFSSDGQMVYVVNSKSPTGPNPGFCYGGYGPVTGPNCGESNEYNPQLTKAGLQSFPRPASAGELATLTAQVTANNRFADNETENEKAVMSAVRQGVQHVIFILKENRTYDQILGDLKTLDGKPLGRGDPALTEFGEMTTPNLHSLARTFVTLDNFLDTAEISVDGWLWSTSAQAPDVVERTWPIAYAYRGLGIESEGLNRNVNVALPNVAARQRANPFTAGDPDRVGGPNRRGRAGWTGQ